jgi:hypothetical protein
VGRSSNIAAFKGGRQSSSSILKRITDVDPADPVCVDVHPELVRLVIGEAHSCTFGARRAYLYTLVCKRRTNDRRDGVETQPLLPLLRCDLNSAG